MRLDDLVNSYINGSISFIRQEMIDQDYLLSEVLAVYMQMYKPDNRDIYDSLDD